MTLIKHDIPILEYDSDPKAVIMADHEHLDLKLPERAVFAFLGDTVEEYAKAHNALIAAYFISATKAYPVYVCMVENREIALVQAPVGASAAVQILDWLISYGSSKIISAGSCGALEPLEENLFLIPYRALRDEGTSYHYLPPSRFVSVSKEARIAIERAFVKHGYEYREVTAWSTDGFFRETKAKVDYRKSEGCSVVEMECAALAACAELRGVIWGELLYTADTLANQETYDERSWGQDSVHTAMRLSVDAVLNL